MGNAWKCQVEESIEGPPKSPGWSTSLFGKKALQRTSPGEPLNVVVRGEAGVCVQHAVLGPEIAVQLAGGWFV